MEESKILSVLGQSVSNNQTTEGGDDFQFDDQYFAPKDTTEIQKQKDDMIAKIMQDKLEKELNDKNLSEEEKVNAKYIANIVHQSLQRNQTLKKEVLDAME